MKLLVLGGSYFLGKWFVLMAAKEHEVTVFNRGNAPLALDGVKEIIGDRKNSKDLELLSSEEYEAVIDFCAYDKGDIESVIESLKQVKHYIMISTCDVLKRNLGTLLKEEAPYEDRDFGGQAGAYILGKAALERELVALSKKEGFFYTILRPAFIYGPGNYAPREGIYFNWIKSAGQILHPEDATGEFQFVYVEDVARAILQAVSKKEASNQIYNLASKERITYELFADTLGLLMDKPFQKVSVTVQLVKEKQIPLPFPLTKDESNWYDGGKALLLLGKYTELSAGLKKTIQAYESM